MSIPVVNHVFDAADVDAGGLDDSLDGRYHVRRRMVAFHLQTRLGRFHYTRVVQAFASRGLADVGRAEVESLTGQVHLNGVEILAGQGFDARDVAAAGRNEFLHQPDVIVSQRQFGPR